MIKQLMLAVTLLGLVAFLPSLGRAGEEKIEEEEFEFNYSISLDEIRNALREINLDVCEADDSGAKMRGGVGKKSRPRVEVWRCETNYFASSTGIQKKTDCFWSSR